MTSQFVTQALTETDLEQIITDVLGVLEAPGDVTAEEHGGQIASVVIHGPVDVVLVVNADDAAATAVAIAFFGEDFEDGDQPDALRELANVCAGASKTMLDGEWTIGIPTEGPTALDDEAVHAVAPVANGLIRISLGRAA